MYWGIDGCKKGWIAIGLGDDEAPLAVYTPNIATFWQDYGESVQVVLIDMPIGLSSDSEGRLTEKAARDALKQRRSSVFAVPTRKAIEHGAMYGFDTANYILACEINRKIESRAFSKQSWNICPKIHELDLFLRDNPPIQAILLESHPELLFCALNENQPMRYSKKTGLGFMERVTILSRYQADVYEIIRKTYEAYNRYMLDDDIVDALVCAVCARMGNFATIPDNPKRDQYGLLMQMLYPKV